MFEWLTKMFRSKAITPDNSPAWRVFGANNYSDPLTDLIATKQTGELYDYFKFASIVSANIRYICDNLLNAPLVAKIDGDEDAEEQEAPQIALLYQNKDFTASQFMSLIVQSYLLTGTAYLLKLRQGKRIQALSYIPTDLIKPIANNKLTPLFKGYEYNYQSSTARKTINPRDILVFRQPDPSDPTENISRLMQCMREVVLDEHRIKFWLELMSYCPIPGLAVTSPEHVPPEIQKKVINEIINAAGIGRRGGSIFLPNKMELIQTTSFGDKFNWESFNLNTEARICAVFGVPPQLLGLESGLKYSTYSNYEEARKAFYQNTMKPLWTSLEQVFTASLCADEGDFGLKMEFNTSEIPEINDHKDEIELYKSGILTKNEVRVRLGYPEIEEEDEPETDEITENDMLEDAENTKNNQIPSSENE